LKIAIDCRFWGAKHTGLGRYTKNLVLDLLKIDKVNHYFLLFRRVNSRNLKSQKSNLKSISNVQYQIVDAKHYSLKEQFLLPRTLKKINPDLVHFPHFNLPIFSSYPFTLTIHDLIKHHFRGMETTTRPSLIYWLKYLGYKLVFKNAVQKAKKIIVPSMFVKKELIKFYRLPQDKIKVIYEGVDRNLKSQMSNIKSKRQISKLLEKFKIKKPFLLYVGNAYPHKNLERLILAVKKINERARLNLVIVCGRDAFYDRLRKQINKFKSEKFVFLTGFITNNELANLYQRAKAFVSASLMEGFGLPGLEAMVSRCPVVCSDIPTFKEIYGSAVIYFNPRNIDDMAEKINKLINLPLPERQELIKKGQDQVKKYSWHRCASEILKIYESCFSLRSSE
jgi:glycosyltransferase involved in cell wall biosynthesis